MRPRRSQRTEMLDLIVNAIEAMSRTTEGKRELLIQTARADADSVLVSVGDSGPGLSAEGHARLIASEPTFEDADRRWPRPVRSERNAAHIMAPIPAIVGDWRWEYVSERDRQIPFPRFQPSSRLAPESVRCTYPRGFPPTTTLVSHPHGTTASAFFAANAAGAPTAASRVS